MEGDLESIQSKFFDAMAQGWACNANAKKIELSQFTGSRGILYEHGPFRVLDCYMTNFNFSTGTTTIWVKDQPVWIMHYGGWYKKEAIPFLKSCLQRAYVQERRFYGGRGPKFVKDERFTYVNSIDKNEFIDFAGEESIVDSNFNQRCLGYHWYRGMSLLKINR